MDRKYRTIIGVIIIFAAILYLYSVGTSVYSVDNSYDVESDNLTNLPTSTPKPRIVDFVRAGLRRSEAAKNSSPFEME